MGKLVSCGTIDKNIIFPLMGVILSYIVITIVKKEIIIDNYPLLFSLSSSFSMCLSFIPYLILQLRGKRGKNSINNLTNKTIKQYKKKRCQRFYFFIFLGLLDFAEILVALKCISEEKTIYWVFDIIIINVLS